jgi:hypothetical protein
MGYNLRLSVFRITLKIKGGSNKDVYNFSEFFEKAYNKTDKEEAYNEFIKDYITSFQSKFKLNSDRTKGIAANKLHKFISRSEKNIIDGEVIGGQTGIPQELFKQGDASSITGNVETDDVTTLPYYIKLWTPVDHSSGVLMVQSYSNLSVTDLIRVHLTQLFNKYNFSLIITQYVPDAVKEHFKEDSNVYKVAFVKDSLSKGKRRLINPLFTEFESLRIRIEVSGFKKKVTEFWEEFLGEDKILNTNLEDFDIKENDDFKTLAYYKDSHGHQSNTSIDKQFEIKPTIFLDQKIKKKGSEYFDFKKLKEHTDAILEDIKREIQYYR